MLVSIVAVAITLIVAFWPRPPVEFPNQVGDDCSTIYSYFNRERASIILPPIHGPKWFEGESNPPLSVLDGIELAAEKRKQIHPDEKKWKWVLDETALVPWNAEQGYWFWRFTFGKKYQIGEHEQMYPGHSGPPTELVLVVLMDGTVLQPKTIESRK